VIKAAGAAGTAGLVGLAGCSGGGGGGGGRDSEYPKLGNYPIEGDTATFGFNVPQSGPYASEGEDELRAYELAVDHLNNGGGWVDSQFDDLSGDGVLDYEIGSVSGDTATDADTALEAALDALIDAGIVDERDDSLVTTEAFEETRRVYRDSYATVDDAVFRRTVADTFGIDEATAAERIEARAITRDDLIAYLSLRSEVDDSAELRSAGNPTQSDDDVDDEWLATMATLVAELSPGPPVPAALDELDDESWRAFLDDNPDAIVTVWRHDCVPCEALKEDLETVLDALPDGVAVAGVDGPSVPSFRRAFDVHTAPAVCCFHGGELVDTTTGRQSPDAYADRFAELYG